MCQCGCGEYPIEQAYELPNKAVVGIKVYPGCRDCFPGPAVDISVFSNKKTEWLEHVKIKRLKPDEYGGKVEGWQVIGVPVPLFEVRDLVAAAKALGDDCDVDDGYATVGDWLEDNGLSMVQEAMRIFDKRRKA